MRWIKYGFRVLLGFFILITLLLFLCGVIFMIPSVQTGAAKKMAAYLSKEMQTEISVEKLRIAWNLDIYLQQVEIQDQHQHPMIVIGKASTHLPSYDFSSRTLHFSDLNVDRASVLIANYKDDEKSNISFFTNYFKSEKPDKKGMNICFRNAKMTNSNFEFLNERNPRTEVSGTWNYSDIRFSDIHLKMQSMDIIDGYLHMDVDHLAFAEYSGFDLSDLSGQITIGKDRIYVENAQFTTCDGTNADLDFRFDFEKYSCFSNFYDSVFFHCTLRPSKVAVQDLKYFVPAFADMNNDLVQMEANVNRPLSQLAVENFTVRYHDSCCLSGDMFSQGLPDVRQTVWDVHLSQISLSSKELKDFVLPGGQTLPLPVFLQNVTLYQGKLDFTGSYQDFECDALLQSSIGDLQLAGGMGNGNEGKKYHSTFHVTELDMHQLTSSPALGKLTADGMIQGHDENIEDYQLNVNTFYINGCPIHKCELEGDMEDGHLTVQFQSDDSVFLASMKGFVDLKEENKPCYSTFDVKKFNISAFRLFRPDSNVALSFKGSTQMHISSLDQMEGEISVEDLVYQEQSVSIPLHRLNMLLSQNEQEKRILFVSDPIRFNAKGNIPLTQLASYAKQWVYSYFPQMVENQQERLETDSLNFEANVYIAKNQDILKKLIPTVQCNEAVRLTASPEELHLTAPALMLGKNELQDLVAEIFAGYDTALLQISCKQLVWNKNDTISNLENIAFSAHCFRDSLPFHLKGEKSDVMAQTSIMDVHGLLILAKNQTDLYLNEGFLCFDKEVFQLDSMNFIRFEEENILVKRLNFVSENSSMVIHGNYSSSLPMGLDVNIKNVNLHEFGWLMKPYKLDVDGIANGNLRLERESEFQFFSQLNVDQFAFNDVQYGDMQLQTDWNDISQLVAIKVMVQTVDSFPTVWMKGDYDPHKKFINLKGKIENFDLKSLAPFLESFTTDVRGNASGELLFKGPLNAAKLNGVIALEQADLRIDYLQTYYHISQQTLLFEDSGFVFNDVIFTDESGNKGSLNGIVSHQHLKDWGVQLDVDANHLMVFNTRYNDNELFYGKAFATGRVHLSQDGPLFFVQGNVRTESPTNITLSLTRNTNVQMQNNYIVFERPYALEEEESMPESVKKLNSTRLLLNLTATPDAKVRVLLDPSIGCTIEGYGNGDIRLEINEKQRFEMYGSYTLSEGQVDLALGNILTRSLKLENGSFLSWNGRPDNGQMNVKAIYNTKTSISSLLNESATSSYKTIPITTCLNLNGNLLNPDFDFKIRLDDVDESIQSVVYNVLDTTNKDEMLQQAFSLLLTGRLMVEDNRAETVNYGIGYSLSEFSSYYLQKMISSFTDKVNLGFQYIQGDGASMSDEYNVQISTNLMENRLSIQGNLNIYGDNGMREEQAVAGNVVGDVIFEYKITKDGSLRIKVFNLANYYDVLSAAYSDVPYYQGVGMVFSKDFNHLKDLFKKNKQRNLH